jgi:hypothetical protein
MTWKVKPIVARFSNTRLIDRDKHIRRKEKFYQTAIIALTGIPWLSLIGP